MRSALQETAHTAEQAVTNALAIAVVPFGAPEHWDDLDRLSAAGFPIPHHYRWSDAQDARWCRVTSGDHLLSGFAIMVGNSRAMPGLRIVRIERFGRALHEPLIDHLTFVLRRLVSTISRVLRVHVELFDEDRDRFARFARQLVRAGYVEPIHSRSYRETLCIRLDGSPQDVFRSFSSSTRRNIRSVDKLGFRVQVVDGSTYLTKMGTLLRGAFQRTHGEPPVVDFATLLSRGASDERSRIFGIFANARHAPDDLVAFAWVRSHGDFVSYDLGAAERAPDLGRTPLMYALLWRTIQWAMQNSHTWFDLGGVTPATAPGDHVLAGITAFKMGFSSDRMRVGREFVLEPNRTLGWIAGRVSALSP